jgi:hypothetical protein
MKKISLRIGFITAAIAGGLLVIGFSKSPSKTIPCKESMEECCENKSKGTDQMIWESLTGQFFTSSGLQ